MNASRILGFGLTIALFAALTTTAWAGSAGSPARGRATPLLATTAVACFQLRTTQGCPSKSSPGTCRVWFACPATVHLRHRFTHVAPGGPGGGCDCQPIIRAQFSPVSVTFKMTHRMGARAKTDVVYKMGGHYSLSHETFVTVKGRGGWRVSDIYCTGRLGSTIYKSPLKPCYHLRSS
jgi:hypothetical protein